MTNIEVRKRDPATSDSAGPAICLLFFYRPKSHDKTSSPKNETYATGMEFRQNLILAAVWERSPHSFPEREEQDRTCDSGGNRA